MPTNGEVRINMIDIHPHYQYNSIIENIIGELKMAEIVKTCKVHGDLTEDMIFRHARKERLGGEGVSIRCRQCKLERNARYDATHREKRVEISSKWTQENRELANAWYREDRKKNPDKYREIAKRSYEKNKKQKNEYQVKRMYGIEAEQYYKMYEDQQNRCAICNQLETRKSRTPGQLARLTLDHNHETGQIRGLLCHSCNTGIGKFRESEDLFRLAIAYLERYKT